jgi:hypothetical protein
VDNVAARSKGNGKQCELAVNVRVGIGKGVVVFAEIKRPDGDASAGEWLSPGSVHRALDGDRRTLGMNRRLSAGQCRAEKKEDGDEESVASHFKS